MNETYHQQGGGDVSLQEKKLPTNEQSAAMQNLRRMANLRKKQQHAAVPAPPARPVQPKCTQPIDPVVKMEAMQATMLPEFSKFKPKLSTRPSPKPTPNNQPVGTVHASVKGAGPGGGTGTSTPITPEVKVKQENMDAFEQRQQQESKKMNQQPGKHESTNQRNGSVKKKKKRKSKQQRRAEHSQQGPDARGADRAGQKRDRDHNDHCKKPANKQRISETRGDGPSQAAAPHTLQTPPPPPPPSAPTAPDIQSVPHVDNGPPLHADQKYVKKKWIKEVYNKKKMASQTQIDCSTSDPVDTVAPCPEPTTDNGHMDARANHPVHDTNKDINVDQTGRQAAEQVSIEQQQGRSKGGAQPVPTSAAHAVPTSTAYAVPNSTAHAVPNEQVDSEDECLAHVVRQRVRRQLQLNAAERESALQNLKNQSAALTGVSGGRYAGASASGAGVSGGNEGAGVSGVGFTAPPDQHKAKKRKTAQQSAQQPQINDAAQRTTQQPPDAAQAIQQCSLNQQHESGLHTNAEGGQGCGLAPRALHADGVGVSAGEHSQGATLQSQLTMLCNWVKEAQHNRQQVCQHKQQEVGSSAQCQQQMRDIESALARFHKSEESVRDMLCHARTLAREQWKESTRAIIQRESRLVQVDATLHDIKSQLSYLAPLVPQHQLQHGASAQYGTTAPSVPHYATPKRPDSRKPSLFPSIQPHTPKFNMQ